MFQMSSFGQIPLLTHAAGIRLWTVDSGPMYSPCSLKQQDCCPLLHRFLQFSLFGATVGTTSDHLSQSSQS